MNDLTADHKALLRREALAARKAVDPTDGPRAAARLAAVLGPCRGAVVAGYMPIRTEIDPRPAMQAHLEAGAGGRICVPVIEGQGQPLSFREWTPDCPMEPGAFGALIPAGGATLVPTVLIVPLVAFDWRGQRLGYGGGFYDRTLAKLREAGRPVIAVGFAYAEQEVEEVPVEPTDQPLDLIVTQGGVIRPGQDPEA